MEGGERLGFGLKCTQPSGLVGREGGRNDGTEEEGHLSFFHASVGRKTAVSDGGGGNFAVYGTKGETDADDAPRR